jgi:hypothetical protein
MKTKRDGKRLKVIGVIVIIVCAVFFFIGQSRLSAADKELREYYGVDSGTGGVLGAMSRGDYERTRAGYYLPGEQMRDFSAYGLFVGAALIIAGFVIEHKKSPPDLLADSRKPGGTDSNGDK